MKDFKNFYLAEGKISTKTLTLYHGVRDVKNVKAILETGFKLQYIKPRWLNDYAVSAVKSKKAAQRFFGDREIIVLKFKFKGAVWKGDRYDNFGQEVGTFTSNPQQFTRDVIKAGIDAADQGGTVFIYNPRKISNIEIS